MDQFKRQNIKSSLKQIAKNRGLTYSDLAKELDCSLPTVKRYFGSEDLTLSRLLQLCDILDVTLGELELLSEANQKADERFSEEQEDFLIKNRAHLAYLFQLFEGHTPNQIAEKFKLTRRSTDKYLIALERHRLVRVTGSQKVRTSFKDIPKLGDGPLGRAYFQSLIAAGSTYFSEKISRDIAAKRGGSSVKDSPSSSFSVFKLSLSKESYEAWAKQQEKSLHEISRLSGFEEKSRPVGELQTMVCIVGHTLSEPNSKELSVLDNIFGEIKNL